MFNRRAEKAAKGFVIGLDWFLRDPEDVVGQTPWEPVFQREKLTVRRYLSPESAPAADQDTVRPAVLLIPPLMVKPYIFDLTEGRSFVETLLEADFDTFLVDFGEPDADDSNVTLDNYVLDWLPAAVDAVCAATGSSQIFLTGYCMGGLFALMHTAANEDERIAGIVTIGSPVDSHKMGILSVLSRSFHREVDFLSKRIGNVPGELSSRMFKLMSPVKQVTRYADLFMNLYDEEYVKGFDALSAWTDNFIDYPQDAFRQLFYEFMLDNKLKDGEFVFGSNRETGPKVANLSRLQTPILAFAGATDNVVREAAVREISAAVGSDDVTVCVAPGGHMGVFAGRSAPEAVWRPAARWMHRRVASRA
ncbi:MAG: alpha/beta fold hydrolase [Myxococcales bacterium]|nr:alpha/beta fold hydrolase [Myxococcales bacterium]